MHPRRRFIRCRPSAAVIGGVVGSWLMCLTLGAGVAAAQQDPSTTARSSTGGIASTSAVAPTSAASATLPITTLPAELTVPASQPTGATNPAPTAGGATTIPTATSAAPSGGGSDAGTQPSDRWLNLVIIGLLVLAALIAIATILFWRSTAPAEPDELDEFDDDDYDESDEQPVVPAPARRLGPPAGGRVVARAPSASSPASPGGGGAPVEEAAVAGAASAAVSQPLGPPRTSGLRPGQFRVPAPDTSAPRPDRPFAAGSGGVATSAAAPTGSPRPAPPERPIPPTPGASDPGSAPEPEIPVRRPAAPTPSASPAGVTPEVEPPEEAAPSVVKRKRDPSGKWGEGAKSGRPPSVRAPKGYEPAHSEFSHGVRILGPDPDAAPSDAEDA